MFRVKRRLKDQHGNRETLVHEQLFRDMWDAVQFARLWSEYDVDVVNWYQPSKTIHCKYTIRQNGTTIALRTYGMQTCGFAGIREIKHISWEWTV